MAQGTRSAARRVVATALAVFVALVCLAGAYVLANQGPKQTPVLTVVAPRADWAGLVANRINAMPDDPARAFVGTTVSSGIGDLEEDRTQGLLVVDPRSARDQLFVSSAQGPAAADELRAVAERALRESNRTVAVQDVRPMPDGDARGLAAHALVIAMLGAGVVLALVVPARTTLWSRRPLRRWAAVATPSTVVIGALGTGAVVLLVPAWRVAAGWILLVSVVTLAASATLTRAARMVLRLPGAIVLGAFLVGLAADPELSGAWGHYHLGELVRPLAELTPSGAAQTALRNVVHLDRPVPLLSWGVLLWWTAVGLLVLVLASVNHRRGRAVDPAPSGGGPAVGAGSRGGTLET